MNKVAEALIDGIPPATVDPVAASLTSYNPSIRERIGNSVYDAAKYLGMDSIANRLRNDVETGIDFVPVIGDVVGADDAISDLKSGSYLAGASGLGLAALGAVPIAGDIASGVGKKASKYLYRDSHLAPVGGSGAPLHALDDLSAGIYGSDIYSPEAIRNYGTIPEDAGVLDIARQYRNDPDDMVSIYRAVPNDLGDVTINPGDWISLSEDYARLHGNSRFGDNYNVISSQVPAREVYTSGDSLQEWGWGPSGYAHQLPDPSPRPSATVPHQSKKNSNISSLVWDVPEMANNRQALAAIKDSGYDVDAAINILDDRISNSKLKGVRSMLEKEKEVLVNNRDLLYNSIMGLGL